MKFKSIDFKKEPVLSTINLFIYIILVIIIYFLLLKITGNSPLFETVVATVLVALASIIYRHEFLLGKFIGEQDEFRENVKTSFQNLREDIQELKKK